MGPKKATQPKLFSISEISLARAVAIGFETEKERAWQKTLADLEKIVTDELPFSKKGVRKAKISVKALRNAKSAKDMGTQVKKLFRHYHQNRLRVFMSCAIEDSIPGDWTCVWSNARVREICYTFETLFKSIFRTKSRLLTSLPVAVVVAFLQCSITHPDLFTPQWWERRDSQLEMYSIAMDHILNLTDMERLPKEQSVTIRHAIKLFRLMFSHLSVIDPKFPESNVDSVSDLIQQMMVNTARGVTQPNSNNLDPLYFTEDEVRDVLRSIAVLAPSLHDELNYVYELQKLALQHSNGDPVGNFCYTTMEEGQADETEKKKEKERNPVKLFTMDLFLHEASQTLVDLKEVRDKTKEAPWQTDINQILYELGQTKVGDVYEMNFSRLFAIIEVFGRDGIDVEKVDCDALAREIADKLTMKGRFSSRRTRTLLVDPRYRKRTPDMLRKKPSRRQDSESDSSSSSDESESEEESSDEERAETEDEGNKNVEGGDKVEGNDRAERNKRGQQTPGREEDGSDVNEHDGEKETAGDQNGSESKRRKEAEKDGKVTKVVSCEPAIVTAVVSEDVECTVEREKAASKTQRGRKRRRPEDRDEDANNRFTRVTTRSGSRSASADTCTNTSRKKT